METSQNWFICSIFHPKLSWNNLICNAIKPYFKRHQGDIDNYFLFFGSNRGQHITVCLRFVNQKASYEQRFIEMLNHFLIENPSHREPKPIPYRFPFADHTNNSFIVHSGFFPTPSTIPDALIEKTRNIISRAILDEFYDIEVDDGNTFSMYIYFQLIFLKRAFENLDIALLELRRMKAKYSEDRPNGNESTSNNLTCGSRFDGNNLSDCDMSIVREIFQEIWHTQEIDHSVPWMSKWATHCDRLLTAHDFETNVVSLHNLISEHLDFLGVEGFLQHSLTFLCEIIEDALHPSIDSSYLKLNLHE